METSYRKPAFYADPLRVPFQRTTPPLTEPQVTVGKAYIKKRTIGITKIN